MVNNLGQVLSAKNEIGVIVGTYSKHEPMVKVIDGSKRYVSADQFYREADIPCSILIPDQY